MITYEKISKREIIAMERTDGITPNFTYEDYVIVRNEETGEVTEEYYTNVTLKTADEVYEETLNPLPIPPSKTEILEQEVSRLEIEMLKMKKGMI